MGDLVKTCNAENWTCNADTEGVGEIGVKENFDKRPTFSVRYKRHHSVRTTASLGG